MELKTLNFCLNFAVRRGTYKGREHLIAPTVILCEGVHSGSGGSLYYPSSELSMFPSAWNGIPVTLNHPEDQNGNPVSANSPEVAEKALGRLWGVEFVDNKLRGDVWVDVEQARRYAPEVLARLQSGQVTEVSTGLYTEDEHTTGTWNNEEYSAIARSYRPDHLAILPNTRGACSVADGCGLGVNKLCQRGKESCLKTNGGDMKEKEMPVQLPEDHRKLWKRLFPFLVNEASFEDTQRALQTALDALDSATAFHYLRKVYDDYCVYEVGPGPESGRTERKLYKRGYSMNDGGVALDDNPTEVREETNYVEIQANTETQEEEEDTMSECKQKVNELIANGAFEESDRPMLEQMECSQVTRLGERFKALSAKPEEKPVEKPEEKKPEVKDNEKKPLTVEDLPEEFQALLRNAKAQDERRKAELVGRIVKFKGNKFTEDSLKAMTVADLENIHDLAAANQPFSYDYSLGSGVVDNTEEEEPLEIPVMNFEKK